MVVWCIPMVSAPLPQTWTGGLHLQTRRVVLENDGATCWRRDGPLRLSRWNLSWFHQKVRKSCFCWWANMTCWFCWEMCQNVTETLFVCQATFVQKSSGEFYGCRTTAVALQQLQCEDAIFGSNFCWLPNLEDNIANETLLSLESAHWAPWDSKWAGGNWGARNSRRYSNCNLQLVFPLFPLEDAGVGVKHILHNWTRGSSLWGTVSLGESDADVVFASVKTVVVKMFQPSIVQHTGAPCSQAYSRSWHLALICVNVYVFFSCIFTYIYIYIVFYILCIYIYADNRYIILLY